MNHAWVAPVMFACIIWIQGTIDWSSVAASGLSFAMAKATEGTSYVDPMFATNFEGMQVKKSTRVAGADNGKQHGALKGVFFACPSLCSTFCAFNSVQFCDFFNYYPVDVFFSSLSSSRQSRT